MKNQQKSGFDARNLARIHGLSIGPSSKNPPSVRQTQFQDEVISEAPYKNFVRKFAPRLASPWKRGLKIIWR